MVKEVKFQVVCGGEQKLYNRGESLNLRARHPQTCFLVIGRGFIICRDAVNIFRQYAYKR